MQASAYGRARSIADGLIKNVRLVSCMNMVGMPARSGSRRVYYVYLLFCLLVIKLLIACELFELVTATALQDQLLTRVVPSTDTSRTR